MEESTQKEITYEPLIESKFSHKRVRIQAEVDQLSEDELKVGSA